MQRLLTFFQQKNINVFAIFQDGNFNVLLANNFIKFSGVVGCDEGVVYLLSSGRLTDIGLQLGKACFPCSR